MSSNGRRGNKRKAPGDSALAIKRRRHMPPVAARSPWRLPIAFPQSFTARLRYVSIQTFNPSVGSYAHNVFSANGCYDPDVTGVGHQPLGFDQWMTFYDHYTVVKSSCHVSAQNTSSASGVYPGVWGITLSDNSSGIAALGSLDHVLESRMAGTDRSAPYGYAGGNSDGQTKPNQITRYFDTQKFFRVNDVVGKADYRGSASTNPNEQAYWDVWFYSILVNDPGPVSFVVTIDYIVKFTEPKPLAQS